MLIDCIPGHLRHVSKPQSDGPIAFLHFLFLCVHLECFMCSEKNDKYLDIRISKNIFQRGSKITETVVDRSKNVSKTDCSRRELLTPTNKSIFPTSHERSDSRYRKESVIPRATHDDPQINANRCKEIEGDREIETAPGTV